MLEFQLSPAAFMAAGPSGPPPLPFGALILPAGDSITDTATTGTTLSTRGFWPWALALLGNPFSMLPFGDAGVGSDTSAQLLARYDADVIAHAPDLVMLLIGTNDLGNAVDTRANLAEMIARNRAIGARTLIGKIMPRGSVGVPMSAPMIAKWELVNAWIDTQAADDVVVWDAESAIGNGDAAHTMKMGHSHGGDNLHPNPLGAKVIGAVVAEALRPMIGRGPSIPTSNSEPGNLVSNAQMLGSAGSLSGLATGTLADSYIGDVTGGAAASYAKIATDDGNGFWQEIVASGTYSGNGRYARLRHTLPVAGVLTAGDRVEAMCEVDVAAGLTNIAAIYLQVSVTGQTVYANFPVTGSLAPDGPYRMVLRTLAFEIPVSVTEISVIGAIAFANAASSTPVAATVRFRGMRLRKLA